MTAGRRFAEFLAEQLAPLGYVSMRRMFGMTGLFRDGVLFALAGEDALFLRVNDANRAMFAAAAPVEPLSYARQGKRIELAYWRAPEQLFDEPEELLAWARAALGAAHRVAAARKARPRPRQRPDV